MEPSDQPGGPETTGTPAPCEARTSRATRALGRGSGGCAGSARVTLARTSPADRLGGASARARKPRQVGTEDSGSRRDQGSGKGRGVERYPHYVEGSPRRRNTQPDPHSTPRSQESVSMHNSARHAPEMAQTWTAATGGWRDGRLDVGEERRDSPSVAIPHQRRPRSSSGEVLAVAAESVAELFDAR